MMPTGHRRLLFLFLVLSSLASLALATAIGSVSLGWGQWAGALLNPQSEFGELVWRLRVPRALAAWVVGALLSLSGCLMQVLLRNPLADPYILGVSGGAALGGISMLALGGALGLQQAVGVMALIDHHRDQGWLGRDRSEGRDGQPVLLLAGAHGDDRHSGGKVPECVAVFL